jgi:hypothetical protein
MSPAWRWRRCPHCRQVERASEFVVLEYRPVTWQQGAVQRACPHCGWEGPTYRFEIVRERHTPQYEAARRAQCP